MSGRVSSNALLGNDRRLKYRACQPLRDLEPNVVIS